MAVALAVCQLGLLDVLAHHGRVGQHPLESPLKCVYRTCEIVGDPDVAATLLQFRHYID